MRIENVAPRTWLLATLAGWTLALWMLGLLGMGGQVQRLADDPGLVLKLPQLAPASPERLGPLTQYTEISARPLFSEDRRPQAFSLTPEGDEAAAPAFDFVLTSVLITPTLKMAIVQPAAGGESIRIKLGAAADQQPAWTLTALNPRSAIFAGPDGQRTLDLRVYDGNGGESPTVLHGSEPAANNDAAMPSPAPKPTTRPMVAQPSPAAAATTPDATPDPAADAQVESIRKRIEERRAQLRQEAEKPAAPAKNP